METKHPDQPRTCVRLSEDITGVPLSPPSSPNYEPDFPGFPEDVLNEKNRTFSRDSGISLQHTDDFKECKFIVHSPLQSTDFEKLSVFERTSGNQEIEIKSNQLLETSGKLSHLLGSSKDSCNQNISKQTEKNNYDLGEFSETNSVITICENLTSVMSKVQEWHAHLQPILAQSRDRHHFDVFELGSEIMNQFDRRDISNKIISLNHVMENKDSSLISRYFLSTLLLANQGNVSININSRSSEIPSELNDVELRLLSKKRNIVFLEDNIGLRTPQLSIERQVPESAFAKIRTLKPVPTATQTEDHDSGISMSDALSI